MTFYGVRVEHIKDGDGVLVGKEVPQDRGKYPLTMIFGSRPMINTSNVDLTTTKTRKSLPSCSFIHTQKIDT